MTDVKYSDFTLKSPPVSGNFVVGLDPAASSDDDKNVRIPVTDFVLLSITNTYTAGKRQDFVGLLAGTAGLNVGGIAGNPTTQVNGDIWINTSTNQIFARVNGVDVDLGVAGAGDMVLADAQTNTGIKTFLDTTMKLRNVANTFDGFFVNTNTANRIYTLPDAAGTISLTGLAETLDLKTLTNAIFIQSDATNPASAGFIRGGNADDAVAWRNFANSNNIDIIVSAADNFLLRFNGTTQYLISATQFDFNNNNLVNTTIVTPTIASFVNATHDHTNAAAGGQLVSTTALSDTADLAYLNQANAFGAFETSFLSGRFQWRDSDNTNNIQVVTNLESADRTITIPVLGGNQDLVLRTLAQTLTNKTLTTPTIGDFTNAGHNHQAAAGGGQLVATLALTATGTKDSTTFLRGDDTWAVPPGSAPPFDDGTALVKGSVDATKLLRFEVDGNTTGITGVIATIFTTVKTITIPDATDTLMGKATTDVMTNKSYDLGGTGNVLTGSTSEFNTALQSDSFAFIGTAQSWTAKQTFQDNGIDISNPAATFQYTIQAAAIVADRILNLPLITGADTLAVLGLAQTFSTLQSFSAGIDVVGSNIDNIQNLIHDLSTSGTDVDFTEDQLQEISISANTTFTGTGYAIGKSKTIKITTDGTLRTLAFPSGWVFIGTKPTDQAASKTGILTLTSFTAAEAGVVAAYAVEA